TAVLHLCEFWWLANGEHKEVLIVQLLPLLVLQACEEEDCFTNKSYIQRLYKLRDAFHCIDFADPSSESLRKLLLRVSSNPLCIKLTEGRKLLASLLQDVDLVKDLHLSFKAQMPNAKGSVLQSYGDIYHRAWKEANASAEDEDDTHVFDDSNNESHANRSSRQTIEHEILQDLMYFVIHAASKDTHQSVLAVLESLHVDKKNKDVSDMLYRLYSPIIWRSLVTANPQVRCYAVTVMEKVFPLHNPSALNGQNAMKEAVLKGTQAFQNALRDLDPAVRAAASKATATICAIFWEALPTENSRALLNIIVMDHASDKTSALVRSSAVEAIATLLGAKQSHAVLRSLLPCVGNLIHDKSEKVRLAVIRMLIRIKQVPGIRFYHVVPVDQIVVRFVVEAESHHSCRNVVTKELTSLMMNSYFPQREDISASQRLKRTFTFLKTNPDAASVFYSNLASHLSVESVVKFIVLLLNSLKGAVDESQASQVRQSQKTKKRHRHGSSQESIGEEASGGSISAENTTLMVSLTNTINVLWESIASVLDKSSQRAHKKLLEGYFSKKDFDVVGILTHFEQLGLENFSSEEKESSRRIECFQTCSALLACISRLDNDRIKSDVTDFVKSSLRSLCNEKIEDTVPLVSSYIFFMCSAGFVDEVAKSLSTSIELSLGDDHSGLLSPAFEEQNGRRKSRRSSLQKLNESFLPVLPSCMGWAIMDGVLQGSTPEQSSIRQAILASNAATLSIRKTFQKGIKFAERVLGSQDDSYARIFDKAEVECIIRASEAYGRFSLHERSTASLKEENQVSLNNQVTMLLKWTTDFVVPALLGTDQRDSTLRDLDLSHISVSDSMADVPPGSPSLTSPVRQKPNVGRTPEAMRVQALETPSHLPATFSEKFASSLMVSSCLISSEMLAMGVSEAGDISKAALDWCIVLEASDATWFESVLPAFVRLAVQLNRASGDLSLLESVLTHCDSFVDGESPTVYKHVKGALKCARSQEENFISLFLKTADRVVVGNAKYNPTLETASSLSDVWGKDGTMPIFLEIIEAHSSLQRRLTKELATSLASSNGVVTPIVAFKAKCLSALSMVVESSTMSEILRCVDSDDTGEGGDEDDDVRVFVANLMETSA
ncbi:MAG: hypothetical protein SGILL_005350, partial [Bacillariaceae sp.]